MFNNRHQNYPSKYSINLMSINRTLDLNKFYIFNSESEILLIEEVLIKASKWKKANPEADVILWYDSKFVTKKALEETQAVLNKKQKEDVSFKFKLNDIRQIDIVSQNPDAFSDNIPVFYRIDLLKLIICAHSIEFDNMQAAIFADLQVGDLRKNKDRMSKEELFNSNIMKRLETIGIQVNQDKWKSENQFIQIFNKPGTINAMKVYINACLSRAITALNCIDPEYRERWITGLCTSVFATMQSQLFQLIKMCAYDQTVLVRADLFESDAITKWVKYDMAEHGHLPFGNLYLTNYSTSVYIRPGSDLITNENVIEFSALIKFEVNDSGCQFARSDIETRGGRHHYEITTNLVSNAPADGSGTYKFHAWKIEKQPILSQKFH